MEPAADSSSAPTWGSNRRTAPATAYTPYCKPWADLSSATLLPSRQLQTCNAPKSNPVVSISRAAQSATTTNDNVTVEACDKDERG